MKAVIMAGGLGSRLKPFTQIIPKPLLPIGEKAILEIQIESLKKHGFDEIYLATNFKSDYIENFFGNGKRFGVKLKISKELKPLGTAGPIKLLKDQLNEPFLIMNGDILSLVDFTDLYNFSINNEASLTLTIKKIVTPYQFGNIYFKGDFVTGIDEKPDIITYALAGIYIMKPDVLELIPDNTYYGMDSLIKSMLSKKMPITKYDIQDYWLDIGQVKDFEEVQEIYKTHFKE
jgi:NDP-sugar pyrophosphorylase family protein